MPSSSEAATRLGWTTTKFNRKLDNVCQKLAAQGVRGLHGEPGRLASNRRARLVEYAIAVRLITRATTSSSSTPNRRVRTTMTTDGAAPMIEIDGYEQIERIGHGGLGDVYRATRTSTGGTVAIKVLRDISDQSVAWHRTRRELTALVALAGHGNVIQLLEMLDLAEGPALVMEHAVRGFGRRVCSANAMPHSPSPKSC